MLGETYHTTLHPDNNYVYFFVSKGQQGDILKAVLFQRYKAKKKFNLAFGDVQNGELDDVVVSNNRDFVKVLSTVTKCVYDFLFRTPDAIVYIYPVDERRRLLYNAICKRHLETLSKHFEIMGKKGKHKESYKSQNSYDSFEIFRRR